jgi:DNA-binding NtrC family response regulator
MVARTIHELSPRKSKPFVGINCSAIPGTLIENFIFFEGFLVSHSFSMQKLKNPFSL